MTEQNTAQAEDQDQKAASDATDERNRDDTGDKGEKGDGPSQDTPKEKPEPDDEAKEKAAEMMKSYEDRPTLIVPGSRGAISGTAVNDWLDDEGNPKFADDEDSPANKAKKESGDGGADDEAKDSAGDSGDSEDHTQKARNVTGADSTTASEGDKTRGEAAEEREREKDAKPMEEQIEEDKEFNKKVIEESGYSKQDSDQESGEDKKSEKAAS